MNVTEILQFVDGLVYQRTGKHLDDVQKAVVEGAYQGKTYSEIGENNNFHTNHLSDVGGDLWKLLSEILGEEIKKSNFRSVLERVYINSPQNICIGNNNHDFNSGSQTISQPNKQDQQSNINTKSKSSYHDLTLAPQIIKFYNRETELKTLSNWIFNQNIRLICVLGLSGIGKTALVKRFVDLNLEQFEVIVWKNLTLTPFLNQIITEILSNYSECRDVKFYVPTEVCQFLNLLKEKRCLIILDNVENIFITGQFAGQYQAEYEDYQKLFTMITETEHQSNIILISQEQCAEMESLDEELYPIKCLELSGLNEREILSNMGLQDEDNWLELITLYEGNLMYLKSIATLINKNYDGQVSEFLAENTLHITGKMQSNFRELFNHLSPIEQKIVLQLSQSETPISREELAQSLNLSSVEFNNGLQSLQQRYLVTKIKENKIMFKLSPVFREYARNCDKSRSS